MAEEEAKKIRVEEHLGKRQRKKEQEAAKKDKYESDRIEREE